MELGVALFCLFSGLGAGYVIGWNRGQDALEWEFIYEPDPDPIQQDEYEATVIPIRRAAQ